MNVADNHSVIARTFVDARLQGKRISTYPGIIPIDLEAAYKIQDAAIALHPHSIGGWKVGRIPAHLTEQFGANRLAGPIFSHQIVIAEGDQPVVMPILPGFAAVEAELMLRINRTPPPALDVASAHAFVDCIRFGLEIASSPFSDINMHGPAVTVSDFGNNFGLVLGGELSNWRHEDLMAQQVEISIDSKMIGKACLAEMLDGPFGSVAFVNNLLNTRGMSLSAGQWISTGAITGVHEISTGQTAHASFGDDHVVSCIVEGTEGR